ncbi:hypothetical protein ABZ779_22470, partial [Micromonospora tulbaghiae]
MDAEPATDIRPCAHCGRDVPQRAGAGRPFRYCRDNDGACQRAARNSRMRHRNSPGLPGQVARTWEAVDRLDQIVRRRRRKRGAMGWLQRLLGGGRVELDPTRQQEL